MNTFELTNNQRRYFGLNSVSDSWDKTMLNDLALYFEGDKIVKVLNYKFGNSEIGYFEYDTNINTHKRETLLPATDRGREQKLTVQRLLKIKGCGMQFSGTFIGGGIHVYDHKRNLFFIRSYFEDGPINNYEDINSWVNRYITESPGNYFEWLKNESATKRKIQKPKEGDVIAFRVSRFEYGFARILHPVSNKLNQMIFPRSLTIATYAFIAHSLDIDIDKLILNETLPSIYLYDESVYYAEMPIIGHRKKNLRDMSIPLPSEKSTSLTIFHTKTDILAFIKNNKLSAEN